VSGLELPASILADAEPKPRIGKGFRLGDLTITVVREKDGDDEVLTVGFQVKGTKRIEGHFRGRERKEFLRAVQDAIHGQTR
jgi:hypothetical protein